MSKRDYQKRGQALMAAVFGTFVFVAWVLMQRLDMQDCINLGIGC